MDYKLLRLAYAMEFLFAMVAIFTAWSEIGGQASLDLMHWAWKFGFSILLASTVVAYTASIVSSEKMWSLNSIRWLAAMVLLMSGMAVVTYFYSMQVEAGQSDEGGNISQVMRAPQLRSPAG